MRAALLALGVAMAVAAAVLLDGRAQHPPPARPLPSLFLIGQAAPSASPSPSWSLLDWSSRTRNWRRRGRNRDGGGELQLALTTCRGRRSITRQGNPGSQGKLACSSKTRWPPAPVQARRRGSGCRVLRRSRCTVRKSDYSGFGLSVGFRVSAGFGFGDEFSPKKEFGAGSCFRFGFRFWVPRHSTRTKPDPLPFLRLGPLI